MLAVSALPESHNWLNKFENGGAYSHLAAPVQLTSDQLVGLERWTSKSKRGHFYFIVRRVNNSLFFETMLFDMVNMTGEKCIRGFTKYSRHQRWKHFSFNSAATGAPLNEKGIANDGIKNVKINIFTIPKMHQGTSHGARENQLNYAFQVSH